MTSAATESAAASAATPISAYGRARILLPGVLLSAALGLLAYLLQGIETRWLGHPIFEALVIAIVLGMIVRTSWASPATWQPGIDFSAKEILEIAIVLLGTSVNLPLLLRAGPVLLVGIAVTVVIGIVAGTAIGRALGLETRHAILVACGNAICGNSAIAAIAPVIGAKREHVASAIAFTAILGVVVILAAARSVGLLGDGIAAPLRSASTWLTIAAMAAMGLGMDLRAMRRVGLPVVLTVTGSLVVIVVLSATVVHFFVHA